MNHDVTHLLAASERGENHARDRLYALLYDDLRQCAHRQLRGSEHTLSTTALVNETFMRFAQTRALPPASRAHFMAMAAQAMRQILVDHARQLQAGKRGGGDVRVALDESLPDAAGEALEVIALDQALDTLEAIDARASRVVQLHFFAGLSFAEIGELEGVHERTIKRDWHAARQMLAVEMASR